MGAGAAVRLSALGARIVGVSDVRSAAIDLNGLDVPALIDRSGSAGELSGSHARDTIFDLGVDLLVLGAASNSVDEVLAARLRAPLVVEGANFGLTGAARGCLHARGVQVIPDILANSSSAAMVALQMASGNRLSHDRLWDQIRSSIQEAVRSSAHGAARTGASLREEWTRALG